MDSDRIYFNIKYRDGILERHFQSRFLGINSCILSFYLVFYPNFLVSRIFVRFFKTREKNGVFLNPPIDGIVNSMEQKTRV